MMEYCLIAILKDQPTPKYNHEWQHFSILGYYKVALLTFKVYNTSTPLYLRCLIQE